MSEQLAKIEKPSVEEYKAGRKLYFVPLIFVPIQPQPELAELVYKYWDQIQDHLTSLETKLSKVTKYTSN